MAHNLLLVAVLFGFQVFKPWAALLNPRKMENANAERLATLIEELDNLAHALKLPMPAEMHIGPLKVSLPEKVKSLKDVYVELFGENPWE